MTLAPLLITLSSIKIMQLGAHHSLHRVINHTIVPKALVSSSTHFRLDQFLTLVIRWFQLRKNLFGATILQIHRKMFQIQLEAWYIMTDLQANQKILSELQIPKCLRKVLLHSIKPSQNIILLSILSQLTRMPMKNMPKTLHWLRSKIPHFHGLLDHTV